MDDYKLYQLIGYLQAATRTARFMELHPSLYSRRRLVEELESSLAYAEKLAAEEDE